MGYKSGVNGRGRRLLTLLAVQLRQPATKLKSPAWHCERMNDPSRQPFALVTDDDAIIRMDACAILEDAGFQPLEAADGDEGIRVLEAHAGKVCLLFTDVQMPGSRNGFDLARETAHRWPKIKILVASGRRSPGPGEMPDGAIFLNKPFSAQVVHTRVKELFPNGERPEPLRD